MLRRSKKAIVPVVLLSLATVLFVLPSAADAGVAWPIYLEVYLGATQSVTSLTNYVAVVYKFLVGVTAIVATVVIMASGFQWAAAAGSQQQISKAQEGIKSAIIGLIIALTSFSSLNYISTSLVNLAKITPTGLDFSAVAAGTAGSAASSGGSGSSGTTAGTGQCVEGSGPCAVEQLKSSCFGEAHAAEASKICQAESNSNEKIIGDKCKDGNGFSGGLFQVNLFAHYDKLGCNINDIFTKHDDNPTQSDSNDTSQGDCLSRNGSGYCTKWNCEVKDKTKYTECMNKLLSASNNIQVACKISSNGTHWRQWTTNNTCGFPR